MKPVWQGMTGAACALALVLLCLARPALVSASVPAGEGTGVKLGASASLQQCLTSSAQAERSATFAGEITAVPGTARMQMRIDVIERMPGDTAYHTVTAPGLGAWRSSAPGVKVYTDLKQVTNLAAPAFYRAAVRFRWINAKGRIFKALELRTRRCEQPAPAAETETPAPAVTAPPASA